MKALKAVTKINLSDNEQQDGNELWMEDLDADIYAVQPSIEMGQRRRSLASIISPSYSDDPPCAGRSCSNAAIAAIRRAYISDQLRARKSSFVTSTPISVFCGTFNVNGRKEPGADIASWLRCGTSPDVYAIGFQEIVDLNAVNVAVSYSKSQTRTAMWEESLYLFFSELDSTYKLVGKENLVGVLLFVFIKSHLYNHVSLKETESARTGFGGALGNKGAVSVRFQLYDSTLCFVCAHLAAQRDNVTGRNIDFHSILTKTLFRGNSEIEWEFRGLNPNKSTQDCTYGILDHDIVFWVGDLNYRIAEFVPAEEVIRRVVTRSGLEYLRRCDQLSIERARTHGGAFGEFQEGLLEFLPTYKYEINSSEYDKRRAPAWCDRILWRAQDKADNEVQLCSYDRADILMSDHRPVSAMFLAQVREIRQDKHLKTYTMVDEELGVFEVEGVHLIPQICISCHVIDIGSIHFMREKEAHVLVKNTGKTLAYVRFIPKLGEVTPIPSWLKVEPYFALLKPGDQVDVSFIAFVDIAMARSLAAGSAVLEEVIVLRLERGADFFLEIRGDYSQSVFGSELSSLLERKEVFKLPHIPNVPLEIWKIIDGIIKRGGLTPQVAYELFLTPGDENDIAAARDCLDSDQDFDEKYSAESLLQVLKTFLQALPEPVVPLESIQILEKGANAVSTQELTQRFIRSLPPVNHDLFLYLLSFFREILQAQLLHAQSMPNVNKRLQEQAKAVAVAVAGMLHPNEDMMESDESSRLVSNNVNALDVEYDTEDADLPPPQPFQQMILCMLRNSE